MDNNEILLKLSLDANNTVNTLNEVNKGVKEIANTVKTTSNIFKEFSGFIKQCYTEFKENTSSIDKMNKALNGQATSLSQNATNINNYNAEVHKINNSQKQANKTFEEGSTNIEKLDKSTKTYNSTVHALETRVKGGIQNLHTLSTAIDGNIKAVNSQNTAINTNTTSVKTNSNNVLTQSTSIESNTTKIKTNTIAMQQATNVINAQNVVIKEATVRNRDFFDSLKLITSGYTLGNIIASEINKIIMSIKQFFTEAINGFKDLGRNVALVKGLILETGESLNVISDKITNVANKTGTLFTDAAEYIKKIVAGGVNNLDEAVKVYENSIALAKLSTSKFRSEQENLNDVTNSAILLLNNYNLKAKDLPTIYNQIAVAAAKSKLDVADFTKYLGGQSAEFASFKGNFSDMISLYAVFANNLRNSSEADVALRAFMKKIQSPTAEMKKFAEDAVKRGLDIDFSPSALQKKGINNYFKELFASLEKFDFPQDVVKDLFNLANASKGFQSLAQAFKDIGENGKSAFENLQYEVINNTDLLQKQFELLQNSLSEKYTVFSNSLKNASIQFILGFQDSLGSAFDDLVYGLNVVIGLSKEFFNIFDIGNGQNALFIFASWIVDTFLFLLKGFAFDLEFIMKAARNMFVQIDLFITKITNGLMVLEAYLKYFSFDIPTKGLKKAGEELDRFLDDIKNKIESKAKELEKAKKDLYDFDNYITMNPDKILKTKAENKIDKAEKRDFRAGNYFVGTGEIDSNTRLLDKIKEDIDKNVSLEEQYNVRRKKALEQRNKDTQEALRNYQKIKDLAPKEIEELKGSLEDPSKSEAEKKQILDNIQKFQQALINNEKNYNEVKKGILIRYNTEISKINEDERKKKEQEYKKVVDEKFSALIDSQKTKINNVDIDNDGLPKTEIIKKKNIALKELFNIYIEWSNKFAKGSSDNASRVKQASDVLLQISNNEKMILKENLKNKLDNDKDLYEKRLENLKLFHMKEKLSQDAELNNEVFIKKERIKQIDSSLTKEKTLTYEQKRALMNEKTSLVNFIQESEIKISDIRKNRINDDSLYEIQKEKETNDLLLKLGLISEDERFNKLEELNKKEIDLLNKKIEETKNIDKIKEYQRQIDNINRDNENSDYENTLKKEAYLKEIQEKTFNDKIKSINILRQLNAISNKQEIQEIIAINELRKKELNNQLKSFIDLYGTSPKSIDKQKELTALKEKINDINNTILVSNKSLNDLDLQETKDLFNEKIQIAKSYFESLKTIAENLKKNNFNLIGSIFGESLDLGNKTVDVFNKIQSFQTDYNKANNPEDKAKIKSKFDTDFLKMGFEETVSSVNKLIDIIPKMHSQYSKLSDVFKTFGKNSNEVNIATKEANELFSKQLEIIPVLGGFLSVLARGLTDALGITKSESDKKKELEYNDALYNLELTKIQIQKDSTDKRLALEQIEYNRKKQNLIDTFTDTNTYNKKLEELEIQHTSNIRNIKEESAIKLLEIEREYNETLLGIKKDSYLNQRDLAYQNYLIEFERLKQRNATKLEYDIAYNKYLNTVANLDNNESKKNYEIQYELQKSIINLKQDSTSKSLELAKIEKDKKLASLEDEYNKAVYNSIQYENKKQVIINEYSKEVYDINKKASDEIRNVNEKNYKEELRAFESLYKDKTNKLKSELQKQYDIINDYNQKVKDLQQSREQDQALKSKRLDKFKTDLANKQSSTTADFYRQNLTEFNLYADTQTQQVNSAFDFGTISEDNRRNQLTQLALQKYLYYQNLANKTVDPEEQQKYIKTRDDAQKEYYDYIFDKEQEKLDLEKANAEKKKVLLEQEINNRNKIENDYINQLDARYKDSAGLYKDSFVQASRDWIAFAQQETMQKLGIDVYKTLEDVGNNIAKNNGTASKFTGATSSNTPSANNPYADKLPNESIDDYIARIKKQDAQAQAIRVNTSSSPYIGAVNKNGYTPSASNPFAVATPTTQASTTDPKLRQTILNNIYSKLGSSAYEQAYKMSDSELIALANKSDIPLMKNGAFVDKPTFGIFGEAGEEGVFTSSQMRNIYNALLNPQSISNNNSSSVLNVNLGAINIVAPEGSNENTIKTIVKTEFDNLANNIKRINR